MDQKKNEAIWKTLKVWPKMLMWRGKRTILKHNYLFFISKPIHRRIHWRKNLNDLIRPLYTATTSQITDGIYPLISQGNDGIYPLISQGADGISPLFPKGLMEYIHLSPKGLMEYIPSSPKGLMEYFHSFTKGLMEYI